MSCDICNPLQVHTDASKMCLDKQTFQFNFIAILFVEFNNFAPDVLSIYSTTTRQ